VTADAFSACRPRLLGIAYGILGELGEAEDVVQDAWLRWDGADREEVRSAEAFLVTVTTRLAVDRLRSARHRRETYVGPWLPEPLVTDADPAAGDPEQLAIEAEQLSLALLGALERCNPVERAVLILRDAFDLDYPEIADAVNRSPANVRQIAVRARRHAGDASRRRPVSAEEEQRLATAFMGAALTGDVDGIRATLAADAILYSDGGGVVTAARKPIYGADKVARFLVGVQRKTAYPDDVAYAIVRVNGDFGVRMDSPSLGFLGIVSVEMADGAIVAVRLFANPERFGPGAGTASAR
jgi:RNA polymerase sigma-70 factor, ECF subfamily